MYKVHDFCKELPVCCVFNKPPAIISVLSTAQQFSINQNAFIVKEKGSNEQ